MHVKPFASAFVATILLIMGVGGRDVAAADIKVLASPGVRGALTQLIPQFERQTGNKVVLDFAVIAVLKRRIDGGEMFDVVIPSPAVIDELIRQGKIAPDTRVPFARTGLGLAIAKGLSKPDITTVENFRRALLNARSVAYSKEGASGTNFLQVLADLGIAEEMRPKLKASSVDAIQRGEAEMAISGMGPAMEAPEAEYVGALPTDLQKYVTFAAGISTGTRHPDAASALLRFLMDPAAAAVFKSKGLEQGVN